MKRGGGPVFQAEDAFGNYLRSAEAHFLPLAMEPVTVIGHSFGSHVVDYLCARHPDRARLAVFIAPALSLQHCDANMLSIVRDDFRREGDPRAEELDEVLDAYTGRFDDNTVRGMRLLLENPRLFSYYWRDHDRMAAYLPCFEEPRYGIDLDSFFRVRESHRMTPHHRSSVPALAVVGAHDRIISADAEFEMLRSRYAHLTVETFGVSAHYPHIEETGRFLDLLGDSIAE